MEEARLRDEEFGLIFTCARCNRVTSVDSDECCTWEVIDQSGDTVVCEECLTPEELAAIYEDTVATAEEARVLSSREVVMDDRLQPLVRTPQPRLGRSQTTEGGAVRTALAGSLRA